MEVSVVDLDHHHDLDREHHQEVNQDHYLEALKPPGLCRDQDQELLKAEVDQGQGQDLDHVQDLEADQPDQGKLVFLLFFLRKYGFRKILSIFFKITLKMWRKTK